MVMSTQSDQCTIISNDKNNMITITAKEESGKTKIVIANVKKADAADSSSK